MEGVLPHLAKNAKEVISVEYDDNLFSVLKQKCTHYPNCVAIKGDGNKLQELLSKHELTNPVLLSLQNTLGPWIGDRYTVIDEMKKVAESNKGEVVISLLRREAIRSFGTALYKSLEPLLGEPDLEGSDLDKGIYRAKNGYESYWFSKEEREAIKERLEGVLEGEVESQNFHIFHVKY